MEDKEVSKMENGAKYVNVLVLHPSHSLLNIIYNTRDVKIQKELGYAVLHTYAVVFLVLPEVRCK